MRKWFYAHEVRGGRKSTVVYVVPSLGLICLLIYIVFGLVMWLGPDSKTVKAAPGKISWFVAPQLSESPPVPDESRDSPAALGLIV